MTICTICKRREAADKLSQCKRCFCRLIEEKVRKGLRESGFAKALGDDAPSIVLNLIIKKLHIKEDPPKASTKTMDELNAIFLEGILRKSSEKKTEEDKFPLKFVTRKECERYCELKRLTFTKLHPRETIQFIEKFEARRPGIHQSIARTRNTVHENRNDNCSGTSPSNASHKG